VETSEFAFRLSVQFCRWLEIEGIYDNIERLRELLQLEQFNTCLYLDLAGPEATEPDSSRLFGGPARRDPLSWATRSEFS